MKKIFCSLFLSCFLSLAVFGQTTTAEMKEFADANYLQIDHLDVPKGIKRIEDQLRENVIDVILHSKTHVPIFVQKREEGYSKNYKKFYGINIRILPIIGDDDFYSLQLFYYNWTTNKYDKKLVKKISRYNVLNELRFATYEILLGKQWVVDNKENIEKRNFERIQDVRKVIKDLENARKKKKKEDDEKKEKLEQEQERERERNLIKREERKKNKKKEDSEDAVQNSDDEFKNNKNDNSVKSAEIDLEPLEKVDKNNSSSKKSGKKSDKNGVLEPTVEEQPSVLINPDITSEDLVLKKTYLYGFANYFQEGTDVTGIIETNTSLKYLGFGGKFIVEKQTSIPSGYRFKIQAGMPVFKEKYKFPTYRSIESDYFATKIFEHLSFFAGLDFTPLYFVGLPVEGGGFQVFENDFLWIKFGGGFEGVAFSRNYEFRLTYLKSLISKSNFDDKFSGSKILFNSSFQVKGNHGAELEFCTTKASGSFNVSSQKIALSYTYKFEN